ncbi:MAG TPA: hypothetical protein PL143_02645 [Rhodocyclaceae bacterium]|nr:hypothetical protein [Rhodocyclaceae bacterium]
MRGKRTIAIAIAIAAANEHRPVHAVRNSKAGATDGTPQCLSAGIV